MSSCKAGMSTSRLSRPAFDFSEMFAMTTEGFAMYRADVRAKRTRHHCGSNKSGLYGCSLTGSIFSSKNLDSFVRSFSGLNQNTHPSFSFVTIHCMKSRENSLWQAAALSAPFGATALFFRAFLGTPQSMREVARARRMSTGSLKSHSRLHLKTRSALSFAKPGRTSKCLLKDVGQRKTYLLSKSMRLRLICVIVRGSSEVSKAPIPRRSCISPTSLASEELREEGCHSYSPRFLGDDLAPFMGT
mmetsp:Transcript_35662/g.63050  ORF Transcript_35662/g.63050 Transcript_35662/m.63050 type:complete len:245 (+) Transcript_35662:573-1307(+)